MFWLGAFLLTLAIEVPLAVACLRAYPRGRVIAAAVLANSVSHPLLCFVLLRVLPGPFLARVLVGEMTVIVLEALVYLNVLRPIRPGHALAVSATLNAASYLVGIAFFNGPA
jgi:hypothetical protein